MDFGVNIETVDKRVQALIADTARGKKIRRVRFTTCRNPKCIKPLLRKSRRTTYCSDLCSKKTSSTYLRKINARQEKVKDPAFVSYAALMESRSGEVEDAIATEPGFSEDDGSADDVDDDMDYMKREMQYVLGFGYESSPTSRDCHTISVIFCILRIQVNN